MRRSIKFTIIGLVIIALGGATPFAIEPIVKKIGEGSILQLAKDGNFCTTDDCEEGITYAIGFLETNYGLSPDNVKWCMGVDVIANYELPFGNALKKSITDQMYSRCGDPAQDEPVGNYTAE
ncbi:hypothetical protein [Brucella pseudogrignonensis]|uniref:Rap1a immunity protein domain-containing protein n=1 Tax=Brucella pseudogrignonensis TaxID=419475 RepID=A0ABU1M430_9HYPH|nr:hypothetical protein [Brucella pseudogrignonensis]MDR6430796.1 hypothetical protein [Brucella pseudogrignonensis]